MTRSKISSPPPTERAPAPWVRVAAALVLLYATTGGVAIAQCPPAGWSTAELEELAENGFVMGEDSISRDGMALTLVPCLADPSPTPRDGVAYEALARWMRGPGLSPATRRRLLERLLPDIEPPAEGREPVPDTEGFRALERWPNRRASSICPTDWQPSRNGFLLLQALTRTAPGAGPGGPRSPAGRR